MTAHVPMTARPLAPAAVSVARMGTATALDQMAYAFLCAYVFCLPWGDRYQALNLLGLACVGLAVLRASVTRTVRKPCPVHHLLLAFVAWVAFSLLWTIDWASTTTRLGTYVQLLILVMLIWELAVTETRIRGVIVSYVLGAWAASAITIYNFATGQTEAKLAAAAGEERWETYRYTVAGVNADELALIVTLSIPMALYLLIKGKNRWLKLLCSVHIMGGLTAILLTATRGALPALIIGLALMFVLTVSRMSGWQRMASVLVCAAALTCAVFLVPKTSWERILAFGTELSQGTLTNRTVIWAAGLDAFRDHAFLGVGAGAYAPAIEKAVGVSIFAHNTFISVLVELGVVGAVLLLALLASLFYCALRMRYLEKCLWLAVLMTWVIGVLTMTWENRKTTWLIFGLVAAQAYLRSNPVRSFLRKEPPWRSYRPPTQNYAPLRTVGGSRLPALRRGSALLHGK